MAENYYHGGAETGAGVRVWSSHTRRSRLAAERDARALAWPCPQWRAVVEWWDRGHGLRPGDGDAVVGCEYVAE